MKKKLVLIIAPFLFLTFFSCATHTHTVGSGPSTGEAVSATQWWILGGLIALNFLIERESKEIECGIISSPWIETEIKVPEYLLIIQKILKNIFPSLRLNNRLNCNHLSKNKEIVKSNVFLSPLFDISIS